MAAAPPSFPDMATAKAAMAKVMAIMKDDENQKKFKEVLDKVKPEMDDAMKKQVVLAGSMPIASNILQGVLKEYGFPDGPMGIMQGFMQLNAWGLKPGGEAIKEATALMQAAAMSGVIASADQIEAAYKALQA